MQYKEIQWPAPVGSSICAFHASPRELALQLFPPDWRLLVICPTVICRTPKTTPVTIASLRMIQIVCRQRGPFGLALKVEPRIFLERRWGHGRSRKTAERRLLAPQRRIAYAFYANRNLRFYRRLQRRRRSAWPYHHLDRHGFRATVGIEGAGATFREGSVP